MKKGDDYPVLSFATLALWRKWLRSHGAKTPGIQLRLFKKGSGTPSITYDEALDGALCFGWIDGQRNKYDDESYLIRFTPRRPGSRWSQINVKHVERMVGAKQMHARGLAEVEAAKADGRWDEAYHSQSNMELPPQFQKMLNAKPKAKKFYEALDRVNKYAIYYRLTSPKKLETREKWALRCIEMLEKGEKFH